MRSHSEETRLRGGVESYDVGSLLAAAVWVLHAANPINPSLKVYSPFHDQTEAAKLTFQVPW